MNNPILYAFFLPALIMFFFNVWMAWSNKRKKDDEYKPSGILLIGGLMAAAPGIIFFGWWGILFVLFDWATISIPHHIIHDK